MQLILHRIYLRRKKDKMDKNKREMFCYLAVFIVLVIIVILNNIFWKLGKEDNNKTNNNIVYLESNNVIYDVPYEEKALD